MNAPDYRTIHAKEGDTLPRCTEFRYRDRTHHADSFIPWPSDGICTSLWEFRVDFNTLTPEEKAKWFPEATRDYDAMTWEKWESMTNAEKVAFNMPALEAWARGEEVEFQDGQSMWRPSEYPGCGCPLRSQPNPIVSSIWVKEFADGDMAVSFIPQEGYTEYRKVTP